jgi:hypothetical protein
LLVDVVSLRLSKPLVVPLLALLVVVVSLRLW